MAKNDPERECVCERCVLGSEKSPFYVFTCLAVASPRIRRIREFSKPHKVLQEKETGKET